MHKIELSDPHSPPFRQKLRKVPFAAKDEFRRLIQEQLDARLIQQSNSPWSSPTLLVVKQDGGIRITVDYRWLNELTVKDAQPLPNIENLFAQLAKATIFTKIDLHSGFYQVKLEPASRQYTAFGC